MPIELRKKAPYTCRFNKGGKVCAAYLTDDDGDYCKSCQQAVERFFQPPAVVPASVEGEVKKYKRIWP
jgi:hypothetical protein